MSGQQGMHNFFRYPSPDLVLFPLTAQLGAAIINFRRPRLADAYVSAGQATFEFSTEVTAGSAVIIKGDTRRCCLMAAA
jgi:hypothetical protein